MQKKFMLCGLFFGLLAVIIGAFATHGLKPYLTINQQNSFETGIRYQIYHAFLLLIIAKFPALQSKLVFNFLLIGILCFSFSIYLLNLRVLLEADFLRFLGPITPIGGLFLVSAWGILIYNTLKQKNIMG